MDLLKLVESQLTKKAVGTLTLGKRKCFRELFFEGEAVYLVGAQYSGKISATGLEKLGFPGASLSRARFEEVLSSVDLKHKTLAEGLFEAGLVTADQFQAVLLDQLAEEVLDLMGRSSSSFHFQEGRVPEYLLNGESITGRTPIALAAIVDGLRSRTKEAPVFEEIFPSPQEIFVFTERGLATRDESEGAVALLLTLELVDGLRTLADIVRQSRLYEHQVYVALRTALEKGYLKKTIFPELRGISTQSLSAADASKYLPYYANAVKYGVDELAARERLAVIYEKVGRIEEAVAEHAAIGDSFRKVNKPAKAIKAYLRALNLAPTDAEIKRRAGDIYIEAAEQEAKAGNDDQAVAFLECALRLFPSDERVFERLLDLLLRGGKVREVSNLCDWKVEQSKNANALESAIPVCRRVVDALPRVQLLRKKLINLYLDSGHAEEARRELEELFRQYLASHELARAAEIVEKLRRVGEDPKVVARLESEIAKFGPAARSARRPARRRLRYAVFAALLAVVAHQVSGFLLWNRVHGTSAVAAARGARTPANLAPSPEEIRNRELARGCRSFLRWFPVHPLRHRAESLLRTSEARAEELRLQRSARAEEALRRAEEAVAEGDRDEAARHLAPLRELPPGDPRRAEAERLEQTLASARASARELLERARALEEKAAAEQDPESWERAYRAYVDLTESFPASKLVRGLRLPIWVDALPRGAEVREILSPGELRPLGATPLVYRLIPGEVAALELTAPGCSKLTTRLSDAGRGTVCFRLSRLPEMLTEISGAVEQGPVFSGNQIILATSEGLLACLDRTSLAPLWKWEREEDRLHRVLAPPLATPEGLVTAWSDRKLRRFSAVPRPGSYAGRPGGPLVETVSLRGLPCTPIVVLSREGLLAVGTTEHLAEFYDAKTLEFRGAARFDKTEVRPTVLCAIEPQLFAGTKRGSVFAIDPRSLGTERVKDGRGDAVVEISRLGEATVGRTESGDLVFLEGARALAEKWSALRPPRVASVAIVPGVEKVAVLEPTGRLHLFAADGSAAAARDLGSDAAVIESLPGAIAVLDGTRSSLLILDPSDGKPLWASRAEAPVSALAADGSAVAVGTTETPPRGAPRSRLALYRRDP